MSTGTGVATLGAMEVEAQNRVGGRPGNSCDET